MTIVTVKFDYLHSNIYDTLFKVFKYSLEKNFPEAKLKTYILEPNEEWKKETFRRGFHSNKIKFDKWVESLEEINDDKIIFMDCDMMVLQPLDEAFKRDFDVCITYRTKCKLPYNGGVVFCRNNKKANEFLKVWAEIDEKMYNDRSFLEPWRAKYAGLNQASLGYLLENPELYDCKIKESPCSIWNECGENRYNDKMKCIHIKSATRRACLSNLPLKSIDWQYKEKVRIWRNYAALSGALVKEKPETSRIKHGKRMKAKPKVRIIR